MRLLLCVLIVACVSALFAAAAEQEPIYLSRNFAAQRSVLPAPAFSNQVFRGQGFERLESAAGAEGLAGEPCYPGPCFADQARPRPVRCKNCLRGLPTSNAYLRVNNGALAGQVVDVTLQRADTHFGDRNRPGSDAFPALSRQQLFSATPKQSDCGAWCSGKRKGDAYFMKVEKSPLPPTTYASIAGEGGEMSRIEERLSRRRTALEAQQNWLRRASDASDAVLREIKHVEGQKEDIERDLKALLDAQASLQLKLRHDQIAARLNDFTHELSKLEENKRELVHYKGEIEHKTGYVQSKIQKIERQLPNPPVHFHHEELEDPEIPLHE